MNDQRRITGLRRFLYGKGALLGILAIGAPAIAAAIITGHKSEADRAVEQWSEQTYGQRAMSALHAVAAKVGVSPGKGKIVSSEQELRAAVQAAQDGDVVLLAPGVYPRIGLGNIVKQGEVVIASADPASPAIINQLIVRQSAGLTLRGLELAADASAAPPQAAGEEGADSDAKPMTQAELREEWIKRRAERQAAGMAAERMAERQAEKLREQQAAGGPEGDGAESGANAGGRGARRGGADGRPSFPFIIQASERITLDRNLIHGPLDNRAAAYRITALMVRGSKQVTLSGNRFYTLRNGMGMLDLNGIAIRDNEFSDIRSDGLHGGDVSNAEISGNVFTDFHPAPADHPDAMQLWSTPRGVVMENISIHNNMVVRGSGSPMQGVFLRDVKNTKAFRNVQIRDNLIMGGLYNGIAICCVEGGAIEGNRVINYPDRPQSWIRINGSDSVSLRNNSASKFLVVGSTVQQSDNRTEQRGKINEAAMFEEWLKAKPTRRRADSALQAKLLGKQGS